MDQSYILNVYNRLDVDIDYTEGSYIVDVNGDRYLDLFSGLSVNNLGHRHSEIIKNIKEQLNHYLHISNFFVSKPTVELAKLLVENTFASKVFFSNSGTEANEAALKLVRKYGKRVSRDKTEVLAADQSFHGRTYGGMTLTGQDKYKNMFTPTLPDVKHFTYNDPKSLENVVSDKTCAVFIELIQGESGVNEISESFIEKLVYLKKKYNFLICIDEVQTGLGRTGKLFAYEHYEIKPDLVTIAKSIGGGLPLGALLIPNYLIDVFKLGEHGTTFGGNPISCIAGKAVLEKVLDSKFQESINKKSKYLIDKLEKIEKSFPQVIKMIRGRGLMIGIEVNNSIIAKQIKEDAVNNKILINITNDNVIRLLPPLTIKYNELDYFIKMFENSVLNIDKEQ